MQYPSRIVGINFRGKETKAFVKLAKSGTEVLLKREPENPYDANAIQVWMAGELVGEAPEPVTLGDLPGVGDDYRQSLRQLSQGELEELGLIFVGFIPAVDNSGFAAWLDEGKDATAHTALDGGLELILDDEPQAAATEVA